MSRNSEKRTVISSMATLRDYKEYPLNYMFDIRCYMYEGGRNVIEVLNISLPFECILEHYECFNSAEANKIFKKCIAKYRNVDVLIK